jgi:hypothetical protein
MPVEAAFVVAIICVMFLTFGITLAVIARSTSRP